MLRNTLFTFFVLIIIFAFNSNVYSQQLLIDENFDYDIGDLTSVSNGAWVNISGNENLIQVSEGSLSYSGYPSSGLQNKIDIISVSTSAEDAYTEFSPQGEGTTTYAGFLVNVANTTGLADNSSSDGDYFIGYLSSTSTTILRARVCIKLGTVVNTFQVGLIASSSITDAVWYNTDLDIGTTYLIVVSYQIITGSDNDIASLWINPPVDGAQPAADLIQTSASDLNEVGRFAVRQGNAGTPNASIDGIRIGTNWTAIFPDAFTPAISVSPSSLSGFTYLEGSGPSVSQSYDISGTDLTPESGNISIIGSTNYEVSSDNSNFTSNIDIAYSGGVLDATSVYVRLKAGLIGGAYDGELITNSGGSALTQNVTCSGFVTKPEPTNHVTAFAVVLGNPDYYYNNLSWIDATGGTEPDGYLIKRSSIDFSSIDDPIDGVPEDNSESVQNIAQGVQYAVFTGYANTTYYYKIYPYTNSGLYIDYKTDGAVPQFSITNASTPSLPLTENFEYPTGSNLTDNGWIAHSGDGTNPIQVNETPLSYSGYINSGIGKSVTMTTTGEDLNRAFTNVSSGSIYASFMVNILSAHTNGDYFFHLGSENSSSIYLARVFVKKDGNDNLSFGVAKRNDADAVYTSFDYALNATYLVVLKYSFNNGTADDDEVSLWINPVLNGTEPNATITQTDAGNDAENLGKMALRQGTSSNAAALILGGIRVADTWIPGSGVTTFQLTVDVSDGWNMVSVPGINPDGQGVDIWWPGKDPSADVYTYSSGYQAVTTTTPGEGYWMKHSGVNEYNTGDEWPACGIEIVAHDPIDAAEGWNMIGGYEIAASTSELTTTPPGLINSLIYGYSDGYQSASNLVPGYGYWTN